MFPASWQVTCSGVLEALVEAGCVIVATSNRAPWELSGQGSNEDLFARFQATLLSACEPFALSAAQDYRRRAAGPQVAKQSSLQLMWSLQ